MIHRLHYGSQRRPLIEVVPDAKWPGMWRLRTPDGTLSDMVNLSRAKDAAMASCRTWAAPPERSPVPLEIKPARAPRRGLAHRAKRGGRHTHRDMEAGQLMQRPIARSGKTAARDI